MKKLLKILLILFGVFVVLFIGAIITIKIMYPPEKVRALVEKEAGKVGKRDIQIKSASLSLFPTLGVTIEGIRISNTIRGIVVGKPISLWALLKRENLDKRWVHVKHNGKDLEAVWREDVQLKNGDKLRISRKGFRTKEPLFALGKLFVAVKVMPLLKRKIEIKKILLERLEVLVEVDKRGSFNFDDLIPKSPPKKKQPPKAKTPPKAPKAEKASQPISLRLDSFEIKNSKIIYANAKTQQEIILDDINQNLAVSFDTSMKDVVSKGLFEIKRMTVRGRGIPVRKSGVYFMVKHNVHVNLKAGNLRIDQFTVGFQKTFITTKGSVKGFDKKVRHLDLSIRTNKLKLQDLFKEVPPAMFPQARKMSVKGQTQLAVTVKGKMDSRKPGSLPAINGLFQIMNGTFKYADLPKAINKLNTDITFTQDSLNVKKLAFLIGKDPVSLKAKVNHFKKPVVDVLLKADVNLGGLKDAVKLPKGVTAQGSIKANIKAKGKVEPKNPDAINVDGQVDFVKVVATTPSVKKPVQLNGTLKLNNQEVTLEKMETKIGRSSFTMALKVTDYLSQVLPKKKREKVTKITYTLNSPLLDLNEMLGLDKGTSKSAPAKSSKSSKSSSGGSSSTGNEPISIPKLPNLVFEGKIRVKKLIYKTLPITNGAIDLNYKNSKIYFSLNAGLFKGKITEILNLNLANRSRIRVTNTFNCKRMEANDFISNFNDLPSNDGGLFSRLKSMDNTVYGKLDLTSKIKTHGITVNELKKNLNGKMVTKLYSGKIKNASILENLKTAIPKLVRSFVPKLKDIRTNKATTMNMLIKQGKVHISNLNIPTRQFALAGYGTIGLDSVADMKMDIVLNRRISRKILRQVNRLRKMGSGAIDKALGGFGGKFGGMAKKFAKGQLNKAKLIPSDKKGRIVPIVGTLGALSKLAYKFVGFKGGVTNDPSQGSSGGGDVVGSAKKAVKKQIDKLKKRAKAEFDKRKKELERKAKEAQKRARAELEKRKKALAQKAQKAQRDAARRAKAEAAKRKKELERKAKEAKEKAAKALKDKLKW